MTDAEVVERFGRNATAVQALNPNMRRWRDGSALVAFAEGRVAPGGSRIWIAAGDPICHSACLGEVAERFAEAGRAEGARVAWFGASERMREGWSGAELVVGAQPVWSPSDWSSILTGKASLRAQLNRARNKGVRVQPWPATQAMELDPVRRAWLRGRGLPPLQFMVETRVLDDPGPRTFLVAHDDTGLLGYLIIAPIPARNGVFVEWIIQSREAPNGTAALLIDAAFRQSAEAEILTLGMVPLSLRAPLSEPKPPPHIRALLAWMRAHAKRFYNFEGLERFKAKFQPHNWEPLYLLAPRDRVGLGLLHAVTDVFAGPDVSPEGLLLRALVKAASDEAHTFTESARAKLAAAIER